MGGGTGETSLSRLLPDLQPPWHREQLWAQGPLGREEGPGTTSPSAKPCCVLLFPSAPSIPTQLRLSPASSTSLVASWADAAGAAWLHLELRNLLTQKVSTTLSARRGLTSYTFQHLQPGTHYWLGLSATAGSLTVVGPNATAWTCEYELGGPSFPPASGPASESKGFLPKPWVHRVILLGPGQKLLQDPALGHCCSGASEPLSRWIPCAGLLLPGIQWQQPVVPPLGGRWKGSSSHWCSVLLELGFHVPQKGQQKK